MFPKHCREVGLKKVSFPLTKKQIIKKSIGKMVYTITNYLILTNGDNWAVTRVAKANGSGLFNRIKKVEIISLPKDTGYIEDSTVDVLNPSAMARIAERERGDRNPSRQGKIRTLIIYPRRGIYIS